MKHLYKSCTIDLATEEVDGDIVATARLAWGGSRHELEFHADFADEREALAFADRRAMAWIDGRLMDGDGRAARRPAASCME